MAVNIRGGVPEWSKGTDCKSVGVAFEGSNPSPTTIILRSGRILVDPSDFIEPDYAFFELFRIIPVMSRNGVNGSLLDVREEFNCSWLLLRRGR